MLCCELFSFDNFSAKTRSPKALLLLISPFILTPYSCKFEPFLFQNRKNNLYDIEYQRNANFS